jgi:hypothetical protein
MAFSDSAIIAALGEHLRAATPPTGETIRVVYDYPPESLGATPAIVVYEGGDAIAYGAANRRTTLQLQAVLYLPLVEYARSYARVATLREFMRDALLDAVLLNTTSGVSQASVTSTSVDTTDYADAPFISVTANIEVVGVEVISPSA